MNRTRRIAAAFAAAAVLLALAGAAELRACTLWAAAGERAAHGGSLIAKNRDWVPEPDEVRLVSPPQGFRFVGLFPVREGRRPAPVAGVNERGLSVVVASAGSLPREERIRGGRGLTRPLLAECATVEEVLAKRDLFSRTHPAMYLLADSRRVAWVEVAPAGRYGLRDAASGVLAHTNHYLDAALRDANRKIGTSSRARLARIEELLTATTAPLSREDFVAFSADRTGGPDNAIWRTGSRPAGERTLATWIVSLAKGTAPELFVRLADPGKAERSGTVRLDAAFWTKPEGAVF